MHLPAGDLLGAGWGLAGISVKTRLHGPVRRVVLLRSRALPAVREQAAVSAFLP
jgi:hypothetical protein